MPTVRVLSGPHGGQTFPLSGTSIDVGRDITCGISLPRDNGISRRHAQLEITSGSVVIHDCASSNGLFVNGSRTASTLLRPGDKIQVGGSVLVVEADVAPSPVSPSPVSPAVSAHPSFASPAGAPGPAGVGMFAANPPVQVSPSAPAAPGYPSSYGNYAAQGSCAPRPGIPYARWLYFLSFSLPPVGVPIGLVYLFKDTPEEKRVGWWTLGWAVFGFVLLWMSWVELEHVMPLLKGLAAIGQPGGAGGPLGSLGGMMGEGQ